MSAAELKSDLLLKMEQLNARQLRDVYGFIENYLNGADNADEWAHLSHSQKAGLKKDYFS